MDESNACMGRVQLTMPPMLTLPSLFYRARMLTFSHPVSRLETSAPAATAETDAIVTSVHHATTVDSSAVSISSTISGNTVIAGASNAIAGTGGAMSREQMAALIEDAADAVPLRKHHHHHGHSYGGPLEAGMRAVTS